MSFIVTYLKSKAMQEYFGILLLYPNWIKFIIVGLIVSLLIQLFYYLHYYNGIIRYNRKIKKNLIGYTTSKPPISIIVCAKNEAENLSLHLPIMLEQEYPQYEVIVVNDGSTDESCNLLEQLDKKYSNLYHTFLPMDAKYMSRKKMCLNVGIKAAHYEHLIIVDADCEPGSKRWLSNIIKNYTPGTDIVLGYSDFKKKNGFLYRLIGYENLLSTIQYMGYALKGKVLKGTCRNLSYKKSTFINNKAFSSHLNLEYGDDDLFLQEISTSKNAKIEFSLDSSTHTNREMSFKNYLYDKERRLMTQSRYKGYLKALLYTDSFSKLMFFIFLIALTIGAIIEKDIIMAAIAGGLFLLKFTTQCIIINKTAKILQESKFYISILLFDLIRPVISLYVAIVKTFSNNKNTWG